MTSSACPNCSPRLPNEAAHTLNRVLLLRPRPVPSITKPVHHWNADHPEARTRQNRHFFSTLLDETAKAMRRIADESGPESVAFAVTTSAGTAISDAAPWIDRLINVFGSPNNCNATEICAWHRNYARIFTTGTAIGTRTTSRLAVSWYGVTTPARPFWPLRRRLQMPRHGEPS